jgi:hypothetical protein
MKVRRISRCCGEWLGLASEVGPSCLERRGNWIWGMTKLMERPVRTRTEFVGPVYLQLYDNLYDSVELADRKGFGALYQKCGYFFN